MLELGLIGVLLPAIVAGLIVFFGSFLLARDERGVPRSSGLVGFALGAAYLGSHWVLVGRPAWIWIELEPSSLAAKHWIFYGLVVATAGIPIVESLSACRRALWHTLLRLVVLAVIVSGTLLSQMLNLWSPGTSALLVIGLGLAFMAHCASWDGLFKVTSGAQQSFLLVLIGAGFAGSILLSGSASLAQLVGALTAGLGALWVLALMKRQGRLTKGASTIVGAVFPGLLLNAALFVNFSLLNALLLILACHAPWLSALPGLKEKRPGLSVYLGILATLFFVLVVLGLAYMSYERPYGYEDF
jgi:hypothetical protein